jgi:hypothetical protein
MLTSAERETFAGIADVLIPAAEGMPSATEADVPNRYLDEALGYRPDLLQGLREALGVAEGLLPENAVGLLNSEHIPAFEALGTLTAGAYFLNSEIRQLIGYPGQVPTPPKNDMDTYIDLLENVMERGQVYREAVTDGQAL